VDPGFAVAACDRDPGRLIDLNTGRGPGFDLRRKVLSRVGYLNPDDRFACPASPQDTTASATRRS
jgi:hypothetical protein